MMLPDADVDVDIDDLIDDLDDDEDVVGLADDDLTTDDDEHRPTTSSSSSPPPTERVIDDETSVADVTAAAADTTDSDANTTSPIPTASADDDVSNDRTSEVTESRASVAELQLNDEQQQQQPSNADDVTDNTCTRGVDSPELGLTTNELQTDDTDSGRQEDVEETTNLDESHEDKDFTNTLAADQQETCNDDGGDKVQICSSDTPDASQQVCQSTGAESSESADIIPSTSSSASATLSTTEHLQHDEVVSASQLEPLLKSEGQGGQVDVTCVPETEDKIEMEQQERVVTDHNDQNDFQDSGHSEMEVKNAEEDESTCAKETQEQTVDVETAVELEQRCSSHTGDEVTSQQDAEDGRDKDKVEDESEVTEQTEVAEEVKVTYEASAKQLDLLSRLAMLKEKAAQRKAQQTSDTASTQDGQETSSSEDREPSRRIDDDGARTWRQTDSASQLQKDADAHILTKNDVNRSTDTDKDKETSSDTNKQTVIATVDASANRNYGEGTTSPSYRTLATEDINSERGRFFSRTYDDSMGSSSVTARDVVESKAQTQAAGDLSSRSTVEQAVLSTTTNKSTTLAQTESRDVPTAENLNVHSGVGDARSTEEAAAQSELSRGVSNSENADVHAREQDGELHSDSVQTSETVEMMPQALSDIGHKEISCVTAAELNVQSVPALPRSDDDSDKNTEDQTDTAKPADSEPDGAAAAAIHPETVDSGSYVRDPESAKAPSDQLCDATALEDRSSVSHLSSENGGEEIHLLDISEGDAAVNYDSDLDDEFAAADTVHLLADIQTLKSSRATDGPGFLYVFADPPRRRFMIGASRSPAKRLRQAIVFNPDLTLLTSVTASGRRAALGRFRRRLLAANHSCDVITGSRDWFTGSDDVMKELVVQSAADATNN